MTRVSSGGAAARLRARPYWPATAISGAGQRRLLVARQQVRRAVVDRDGAAQRLLGKAATTHRDRAQAGCGRRLDIVRRVADDQAVAGGRMAELFERSFENVGVRFRFRGVIGVVAVSTRSSIPAIFLYVPNSSPWAEDARATCFPCASNCSKSARTFGNACTRGRYSW